MGSIFRNLYIVQFQNVSHSYNCYTNVQQNGKIAFLCKKVIFSDFKTVP